MNQALTQSESALEGERNLLRLLIDNLPACIYVKDLDGRFLVFNAASVRMVGAASEAQALRKTVFDFFPREIASLYDIDDHRVLLTGEPVLEREEPTEGKDGERRWFLTTKLPLRDSRGVIGLLGISQDITDRKKIQAALDLQRMELQLILDTVPAAIFYKDREHRVVRANEGLSRLLKLSRDEIEGKTDKELGSAYADDYSKDEDKILASGEAKHGIIEPLDTPTGIRWLRTDKLPHRDENGQIIGVVGFAVDITDQREAQEKIIRLNQELEERVLQRTAELQQANKELEAFSYSVSHDLRAPLRHIHGYVDMLKRATEGQLSEKAQRYLQTVTRASIDMGRLIDDLLAFSKTGRVELREGVVDMNNLTQEVIRGLEMETKGRNIEWKIADLPQVNGDAGLLRQVLANLLGNAVKYSRGRDLAKIEMDFTRENDGRVVFRIADNGAGFEMAYASKLFGVFQRLHRAEEFEGTGIGVATVQRIIQRHGARLWTEAVVDQGAKFFFSLKPVVS